MADNRSTAPVTAELLKELTSAELLVKRYGAEDARINDKDHYGAAVLQLEALAKAVLSARASVPLLAPQMYGARFHTDSGAPVMKAMDEVVPYLGQDATDLMRNDGGALSKYKLEHTTCVVGLLRDLRWRLVSNIRSAITGDLAIIATLSAANLVDAANLVAGIASGEKPAAGIDDPHTPN